ncbi:MAG: hypothetical protein WBQ75_23210, partial [Acetobacteraceae bacterium]
AVAGNAGAGAAIGAGTGLVGGTAVGANQGAASQYSLQQQYNIAYTQCMYSRGNSVRSPPPGFTYGAGPAYGPYPAYPYAVGYPGYPGYIAPTVIVGGGGWHGRRWYGGGWHY